jgi:serine O-acetyltransferase
MDSLSAVNWHAIRFYRLASRLYQAGHPSLARLVAALNRVLTGVEIQPGAHFGDGLSIKHGVGIVVDGNVRTGHNCTIYQQVTLGIRGEEAPTIGDDVTLFPGCRVVGGITIGDGAKIGANAVVLKDVPPGATAVGIPARIYIDGKPV